MKIIQVYEQYQIPQHLRRHMLRVAAVGNYIAQNWQQEVDRESIVETLLLHDLGNLLKFNLENGLFLFDSSERDLQYWLNVQNSIKEKYSSDEHQATKKMALEIGTSERVLYLLNNMGSSNLYKTVEIDDFELKIVSYSDFRVSPHGFVSVEERFADILKRYEGGDHALANREKTIEKKVFCLQLEEQIKNHLGLDRIELPENQLYQMVDELNDWTLSKEE